MSTLTTMRLDALVIDAIAGEVLRGEDSPWTAAVGDTDEFKQGVLYCRRGFDRYPAQVVINELIAYTKNAIETSRPDVKVDVEEVTQTQRRAERYYITIAFTLTLIEAQ